MEHWKPIVGYEGLYDISDKGNVYSHRKKGCLILGVMPRYTNVTLSKNGSKKVVLVHRLVATAFCEKGENDTDVNHINEDTHDNRACNLEWCTRSENIRHGGGIQRRSMSQRNGKRSKQVTMLTQSGKTIKQFESFREMQRQTGFDKSFVSRCIRNGKGIAYGFMWRLAN